MFSEYSLWGTIQRLMLQGYNSREISKKLSMEEWKIKRHMSFLKKSLMSEEYKRNNTYMKERDGMNKTFDKYYKLKECDVTDILAEYFNVKTDNVSIEIVPVSVGYGLMEHTEEHIQVIIKADEVLRK